GLQREVSPQARHKTLPDHATRCRFYAAPTLANLLTGSAVMLIQGNFETFDQSGSSERLGQEANGSRLQRTGADALFGKGRDKNKRNDVPLGAHIGQKVQA